jgi:integrase
MKVKFTKSSIQALQCEAAQSRKFIGDTHCRGLCLEVRASGGKTYYLSYRDQRGRQRHHKLANAQDITPQQARRLCDQMRMRLALGEDVAARREIQRTILSVQQFFDQRYLPHAKSYKRSWDSDLSIYRNHIGPALGSLALDEVDGEHISRLMASLGGHLSKATANRVLVLLRFMFNLAIRWEVAGLTKNPTAQQPLHKLNNHRERFLSAEETQRLIHQVNRSLNPVLKFIIPMLLLTGARKREVLDARWQDFDLERRVWRIAFTKSGRERHIPLSDAALQLLANVPRLQGCDWVFANPRTRKPFVTPYISWNTARRAAGLADLRIHDLRHSFASFLVNAGCSLYEVQRILGHSSVTMTQRYSHLSQASLLRAVSQAQGYVSLPEITQGPSPHPARTPGVVG